MQRTNLYIYNSLYMPCLNSLCDETHPHLTPLCDSRASTGVCRGRSLCICMLGDRIVWRRLENVFKLLFFSFYMTPSSASRRRGGARFLRRCFGARVCLSVGWPRVVLVSFSSATSPRSVRYPLCAFHVVVVLFLALFASRHSFVLATPASPSGGVCERSALTGYTFYVVLFSFSVYIFIILA
jgi:hypothetical protein